MYRITEGNAVIIVSDSWMDAEREAQPAMAANPSGAFALQKQDETGQWKHIRRVEPARDDAPVSQN